MEMRASPVIAALRISCQNFANTNIRTAILPHSVAKRKGLSPDQARETLNVLLDSGGAMSHLNEPGFTGVCPTASP
jgi:hypothetical protein